MVSWMCVGRLYYLRIALQDVRGCFKKFVMTKAFGSVRTTALWDQGDLKSLRVFISAATLVLLLWGFHLPSCSP